MKKYLSTGLVILIPIVLTIWIVSYVFNLFTAPLYDLAEMLVVWYESHHNFDIAHHKTWVHFFSKVMAFVMTLLCVFLLGYFGRKFFFDALLNFTNRLLQHVPFIGTIYRLTKDVTQAMLSTDQKTFKGTVIIPFPSASTHTVGFIMGPPPEGVLKALPLAELCVFVPTAPHPISGYLLFTSKEAVHNIAISVEDTFKFLLSCGVIHPGAKTDSAV